MVSGTSYAAPLFASAILRYSDTHDTPMGFGNPIIYAAVNAGDVKVHDIKVGAAETNELSIPQPPTYRTVKPADTGCCKAGTGYDMASGLGSVDVASLLSYKPK